MKKFLFFAGSLLSTIQFATSMNIQLASNDADEFATLKEALGAPNPFNKLPYRLVIGDILPHLSNDKDSFDKIWHLAVNPNFLKGEEFNRENIRNVIVEMSKIYPIVKTVTENDCNQQNSLKFLGRLASTPFYIDLHFQDGVSIEKMNKILGLCADPKYQKISGGCIAALHIGYMRINTETIELVTKLTNLHTLDISGNQLTPAGARHIAAMTNLRTLDISDNNLTAEGAQAIANMTNLLKLNISSNNLTDAGARHIATLTNLHSLRIASNNLTDAGAKHIATMTNLSTLDISDNLLTDAGAQLIANMTNLHTLGISFNHLTEAAITLLRNSLPKTRIVID